MLLFSLCVHLFVTPWTVVHLVSVSFTISCSLLKLISIESVMSSIQIILCHPLLLLPSIFPGIRLFSNELALCIRWPKYWSLDSASVLPVNIQGWFPLGLTVWSPCSSRDSQETSPAPELENINSVLSLLYGPTLTSVHDYWEKQSFDYKHLCQQSDISAF